MMGLRALLDVLYSPIIAVLPDVMQVLQSQWRYNLNQFHSGSGLQIANSYHSVLTIIQ